MGDSPFFQNIWKLTKFLGFVFIAIIWALMMGGEIPSCSSEKGEWKTITNEQYNFSVDYPAIWIADTYGEFGNRGERDVKLSIEYTMIEFHYQAAQNPTLDDVVSWFEGRLYDLRKRVLQDEDDGYEQIFFGGDVVDGHPIMRRRYKLNNLMYEEVYIARQNDMFIIELQIPSHTREYAYDNYFDYFDQVVASFRPMQ